jgi:TonB family protein
VKRASHYALAIWILTQALAFAQQPDIGSSAMLGFENGTVANGIYSNRCLGFSLPIPAGWELTSRVVGTDLRARHVPGDVLRLFAIEHREERNAAPSRIVLTAQEASDQTTAERFVADAVASQLQPSQRDNVLIRDTYTVDFAGKHFVRSDYKHSGRGRDTSYVAFVYTKFRGYFIGENLIAPSPDELNEAASSLQGVSFQEDQVDPKCVMLSSGIDLPDRVRVSAGVATALLIKTVSPDYPASAKKSRLQGMVVVQALIDKNGDVEEASLVSGDLLLGTAALEAVKKWKYKPYLVNSQPVEVETQIVVNFSLAGS